MQCDSRIVSIVFLYVLTGPLTFSWADALEEVVVTARKKTESLQDTPVSVSAFTADDIEARAIDTVTELGQITPNVVIDAGTSASGSNSVSTIFIRGVGQTDFTLSVDPGVGMYVDGVYYGQQVGTAVDFLDLERVEILRGPQGTLFGRNTIGGAVSIITKLPAETFGGQARVVIGSDDRIDVSASVNLPLSETLLSKFSFSTRNRDGYVDRAGDDRLGDDDSIAARGSILWKVSGDLSFQMNADYTREREEVAPEVLVAVNEAAPIPFFHNFITGAPCFPPPGSTTNPACFNSQWETGSPYKEKGTFPSASELDSWGVSLTADWDIGPFTVKSISAYRNFESFFSLDNDHSPLTLVEFTSDFESRQFTQELQFLGNSLNGRLDWIIGLYYYDESSEDRNPIDFSIGSLEVGGDLNVESFAAFSQATYQLTDKLEVTLGIRYTDEEKIRKPDSFLHTPLVLGPTFILPAGTRLVPNTEAKLTADAITPLANVTYHWTDNLMTYFTYSEGFKGGGFTDRVSFPVAETPTFDPEEVESYEIGLKSSFLDERVRVNMAAFYVDYTDIQILVATGIAPTVQNAAAAEVKGFEVEVQALPTENLKISGGVGYIDAEYTEVDPFATEITASNKFPKTPEWSTNLSVSYDIEMPEWGTLTPRVDWAFRDSVFNDALNNPLAAQDSFHLLNASLRFTSLSEKWGITLSGKNITDEEYILNGKSNGAQGVVTAIYARPAEWNLSLDVKF